MWVSYVLFAVGLLCVIKGSDWFIDSAVSIARIFRVPQVIIGATLVSFGTTLPEFFVSTTSALQGDTSLAFGNAFGSIACNTGMILALVILLSAPELVARKDIVRNALILLALMIFVTVWGILFQNLNWIGGIVLLLALAGFVYINIRSAKAEAKEPEGPDEDSGKETLTFKTVLFFLIGAAAVVVGSILMVNNGQLLAEHWGVPSSVIGFTVLAIGTSLPELVTAISSLIKKAHGVAIGNVLGANILNIVLVTAASSLVRDVPMIGNGVPAALLKLQIPLIFVIVVTLLLFVLCNKKRLPRICGAVMLLFYITFAVITVMGASFPVPWIADLFAS